MHTHPALAPAKPLWKWSGGKQRLLPQLLPLLPQGERLIEPFVGAGSVFLATSYEQCVLNDVNPDLIAAWVALKERPREFIERASAFFSREHHSREAYLAIRSQFNALEDRFERAVRLPYLNRFGFNGLFRVNRKGEFNVPYGDPSSLPVFDVHRYEAVSARLSACQFHNGGFARVMALAGVGDVLYCDPPYLDSDKGASFTGYSSTGFTMSDHEQLYESAVQAVSRGAVVVISNHDTPATRKLFRAWHVESVSVRRSISADPTRRGQVQELIAILPLPGTRSRA